MSLGSVFKNILKKTKPEKPSVPQLDSKKNDVPMPADPFSQSNSENKNSQFDDLPDFPDFPGMDSKENNDLPAPNPGISAPNEFTSKISEPKPIETRSENKPNVTYQNDYEEKLRSYETQNNDKKLGHYIVNHEGDNDFINIHDYKEVLETVDGFKENLSAFDSSMMQLNDLNNNCSSLEDNFRKTIEDIQRKLIFVDKTLFESHEK